MPDLEDRLAALTAAIDWPPTPRLRIPLPARRGGPGWGRSFAYAAAAVALIVAALLAYTPTRDAIASWVNLHVTITRVQEVPTPSPRPSGPLGQRLGLGTPTTLDPAQAKLSWQIGVPASLGRPDEVFLQLPPTGPSGGEVTLVYAQRPDIPTSGLTGVSVLVTEARGSVDEVFFQKMVGPDSTIEQVTVRGHAGYWISGHPHDFVFIDASGNFRDETMRLATNTLIFDLNGTIVRIEGDMTKAQALQIANSV
ncbi:MAG: hypothetical protein E6J20_10735 [Chloroflexi bacterium]|nr:MAG: hypothetical protein E6J20_10735 [Chloroflexota bacterium]